MRDFDTPVQGFPSLRQALASVMGIDADRITILDWDGDVAKVSIQQPDGTSTIEYASPW